MRGKTKQTRDALFATAPTPWSHNKVAVDMVVGVTLYGDVVSSAAYTTNMFGLICDRTASE